MLLVVDIGNTNTKFALFEGAELRAKFPYPTLEIVESSALPFGSEFGSTVDDIVICSVVPAAEPILESLLAVTYSVQPKLVGRDIPVHVDSTYDPPGSIGIDRLINSVAAREIYGVPCIVCSFGTATTFDALDESGTLVGGAIAPGAALSARALHEFTARLPLTDPSEGPVLGNSTDEAIRSGVFWGQLAMAEGMISRFKTALGSAAVVIATGGFTGSIAEHTTAFDHVDADLTLKGIRLVYDMHRLNSDGAGSDTLPPTSQL